ncbi:hypothetical protein ACHHYP_10578 [Achlya hypogyna]|uniref:Uncharacterized protein n=1 Tax=Achlya hypogyna TaxID=1202772 RepID=A0A1V9YL20_ACHHY|nr:hypothetical protein ACHHYP_10578 [Achlya hypogyna]
MRPPSSLAQEYAAYCRKKTSEPVADAKTIFEKQGVTLHVDNLDPEELRLIFDFIAKTQSLVHARIFLGRVPMKRALRSKLLRIGLEQPYATSVAGYTRIMRCVSAMLLHATSLVSLDLVGVPIAPDTVADLANGLKGARSLVSIDLTDTKLGDAGLDRLEDALALQPQLLHLCVASCGLTDASGRAISRILRVQCQRRDETYWSATLRGQSVPVQGEGCMLLNVAQNTLGDATIEVLCQALYNDNWLYGLNLSSNQVGPRGVLSLAEALQTNATLTVLVLADNSAADARVTSFLDRLLAERREKGAASMNHPMEHPVLKRVLQQWKVLAAPPPVPKPVAVKKPRQIPPQPARRLPPPPKTTRRAVTSIYAATTAKKKPRTKAPGATKPERKPPPVEDLSALDYLMPPPAPSQLQLLPSNQEETKVSSPTANSRMLVMLLAKIDRLEEAQASAQAHIDRLESENRTLKQQLAHKPRRSSVEAAIIGELEAAIVRLTQQVQFLEQSRPLPNHPAIADDVVANLASQLKLSFGLTP